MNTELFKLNKQQLKFRMYDLERAEYYHCLTNEWEKELFEIRDIVFREDILETNEIIHNKLYELRQKYWKDNIKIAFNKENQNDLYAVIWINWGLEYESWIEIRISKSWNQVFFKYYRQNTKKESNAPYEKFNKEIYDIKKEIN